MKTCAIPLSHGWLLQAGLGAGGKAPQLGWWCGALENGILTAYLGEVTGHCRRLLAPCPCRAGEKCPVVMLAEVPSP